MKLSKPGYALLLGIMVTALGSNARAVTRSLPGAACDRQSTSSSAQRGVTIANGIFYSGVGESEATCPLHRGVHSTGSAIRSMSVYLSDNSTTEQTTCYLYRQNPGSGWVETQSRSTGRSFSGGYVELAFSMAAGSSTAAYSLTCSVAQGNSINSYVWEE